MVDRVGKGMAIHQPFHHCVVHLLMYLISLHRARGPVRQALSFLFSATHRIALIVKIVEMSEYFFALDRCIDKVAKFTSD